MKVEEESFGEREVDLWKMGRGMEVPKPVAIESASDSETFMGVKVVL
jgi:hypothetical protein